MNQPHWHKPVLPSNPKFPSVFLYNSLTRKKEQFIPRSNGSTITWYNCGPTVYNVSHMGHARTYITFDIIRRVMEDYFNFRVHYVMNITDVDDKIIRSARKSHLLAEFQKFDDKSELIKGFLGGVNLIRSSLGKENAFGNISNLDDALAFCKQVEVVSNKLRHCSEELIKSGLVELRKHRSEIETVKASGNSMAENYALIQHVTEIKDKLESSVVLPEVGQLSDVPLLVNHIEKHSNEFGLVGDKFDTYLNDLRKCRDACALFQEAELDKVKLLNLAGDSIASYLDEKDGHKITDNAIFQKLSSYYEKDYFGDMEALNVKSPSVLTRVTQYVPEIIDFILKIMNNGYAYESNGSVYFDVNAFKKGGHDYAKLAPWAAGNSSLLAEGEGSLSLSGSEKRNLNDFALWKKSKPGEPFWDSPWGNGRPGWHIECSAMAGAIFGDQMDIHSGGIDLCFPHHDNELAQSEAFFNNQQWVNYFLHSGHLHIEGQKMSKSLKNFISIKEALAIYPANQIRYMFLLHQWNSVLDFKKSSLQEAAKVESTLNNFFQNVAGLQKLVSFEEKQSYREKERALFEVFAQKQDAVREALSDNIDTPRAMDELLGIVNKANIYIQELEKEKKKPNVSLLQDVVAFIKRLLTIFGVKDNLSQLQTDNGMPYLEVLSKFRAQVRDLARAKSDHVELLKACDQLRDKTLPELGVIFEDKGDYTMIKFGKLNIDEAEESKKAEKQKRIEEERRKKQERLEKGKTEPSLMFKTTEFSQWDEQGLPTHDAEGAELAKSRRKKLAKEYQVQERLHREYLEHMKEQ